MTKKLNKTEIATAKSELLKRKLSLEERLSQMAGAPISVDQVQDSGDQALVAVMESLRSSLQDSEYQEYTRTLNALKAIDNGTYGICSHCGEPIAEKRLKFNPHATRCIACQEAFEAEQ